MTNQYQISNDPLYDIRNIISQIEEKSASGNYIYRGEPEHHEEPPYYGKICSSLYRQYARIEADEFDIETIQGEILNEAKAYSHETNDPIEIITQLQHYGGKTNLIDFTTDHLIALFFACNRSVSLKEDGRIILLEKNKERKNQILHPRNPRNRVIAQKSVFVRHPDGFLSPDEVEIITIPARLKQLLLTYLQKYHDISTENIYNDLHGFIINQRFHENAYSEFHRGLTSQLRGYEAETFEEKQAAYEKSIMYYSRALKLKPDLPDAFLNRGDAYLRKGDFDLALSDFSKAIEMNPNNVNAFLNRGDAYLRKGDFDLALSDFSKAIEMNPNNVNAFLNRGDAYLERGDFDLALSDFNKAIELNSDNADVYIYRGNAYLKYDKSNLALADFSKAIEMNSNDAAAYIIRGDAYFEHGDLNLALTDFSKAIELNPDNANAYIIRGKVYHKNGNLDLAKQDYEKAIELDPDEPEAYYNLSLVWMQKQNWQEAKLNLMIANILKMDFITVFYNTYESVEGFEQTNDIMLPEDIAAMLTSEE
jgi:tetratricopeptide (TPR) repeat protein